MPAVQPEAIAEHGQLHRIGEIERLFVALDRCSVLDAIAGDADAGEINGDAYFAIAKLAQLARANDRDPDRRGLGGEGLDLALVERAAVRVDVDAGDFFAQGGQHRRAEMREAFGGTRVHCSTLSRNSHDANTISRLLSSDSPT